ncbi:AsmA-like C-terminal domain-containing protein [Kiloniella sp. EL199]|uniref:YhdP family protein n=1 Tax=Kiloniella sp. EL199 TaxID=2107581 RepID=UPI000EA3C1D5|nr:AsmA-like C-terminal domain-containing protein [Kiloniella sp. EL199]
MIRKTSVVILEVIAALLVLSAVLAGIAIWRLSSGPVQLDFLTPYVEEAFADPDREIQLDVDTTVLVWLPKERAIAIQVANVRLLDSTDRVIAAIPLMGVDLDAGALVRGNVVPTGVDIIGPELKLVRAADGHFEIDDALDSSDDENGQSFGEALPEILDNLMAEREAGHPLAYFNQLQIVGARMQIDDRKLGMVFDVPYADISIRRDKLGLQGDIDLTVDIASDEAILNGAFVYDSELQVVDLAFQLSGINPPTLAQLDPALSVLETFEIPLAASVATSVNVQGEFGRSRFEVSGGSGTIEIPDLKVPQLPVQGLFLKGSYSRSNQKITVDNAAINFGLEGEQGPQLSVAGSVSGLDGDMQVLAGVKAVQVPVDDLALYWPEPMATDARAWVTENIKTGIAEEAVVKAVLDIPAGDFEQAKLVSLDGSMKYRDLDVHYLRPLPPVKGVAGTAKVRADGLSLFTEGGRLEDMSVLPSTIEITGLDIEEEHIAIQTAVEGPVNTALSILNSENLRLIDELGIKPEETSGNAAVAVDFAFLLLKDLKFKDMSIDASAEIKEARIGKIYNGHDATDGDLKLNVTREGMHVTGPLLLADIPLSVDWKEQFGSEVTVRTNLKADIPRIEPDGLSKLGIPVSDYLEGPVSLALALENKVDDTGVVQIAANLQDALLKIEDLKYFKQPKDPGQIQAIVSLVDGEAVHINSFNLEANDFAASGELSLTEGKISTANLDQFQLGKSLLTGVEADFSTDKPSIVIGGGVLDAEWFVGDAPDESINAETSQPQDKPDVTGTGQDNDAIKAEDEKSLGANQTAPISVIAENLDAIYMAEGRFFRKASLWLDKEPEGWKRMQFSGEIPKELWYAEGAKATPETENVKRTFSMAYQPLEDGRQGLNITANDFGAMLRALDVLDTVQGGSLQISGIAENYYSESLLKGNIEARGLRLVKAPTLAKMLAFASLTGPVTTLTTEGIAFNELKGDFTLQNGLLRSDLIKLYSSSIGLTAKGEVDTNRKLVAAKGTIVPAYTINRILGGIPILGDILTGGDGQGIVAFNYSLNGDLEEPEVSINPLSGLAPGFLRNIFGNATPTTEKKIEEKEETPDETKPEK